MTNRRKIRLKLAMVLAIGCLSLPGEAQTLLTPSWLRWVGDGSGANYVCSSGTCSLTDEIWFKSFTLSPGATLVNNGGNGPLIIRATGACTIEGTVSGSSNSGAGVTITGNGDFGGGGGGGGGGTKAGINGKTTVVVEGIPIVNGGFGGSAGGGNGQSGVSTAQGQYRMFLSGGSPWPGGGAMGGAGGSGGGAAGYGGTPVIFICNTIDFTGTIDVSGGNGGNATASNTGAGGGGGAGYVVLAAVSYTANTGTINTSGGIGGSCNGNTNCGTGGNGGNGWSFSFTIQ